MNQLNPLELQLSDFGINDESIDLNTKALKNRRSSIGAVSRQFATPIRQKPVVVEDQMSDYNTGTNNMRLSFLEKKLVERSRFRNLETTLKQT